MYFSLLPAMPDPFKNLHLDRLINRWPDPKLELPTKFQPIPSRPTPSKVKARISLHGREFTHTLSGRVEIISPASVTLDEVVIIFSGDEHLCVGKNPSRKRVCCIKQDLMQHPRPLRGRVYYPFMLNFGDMPSSCEYVKYTLLVVVRVRHNHAIHVITDEVNPLIRESLEWAMLKTDRLCACGGLEISLKRGYFISGTLIPLFVRVYSPSKVKVVLSRSIYCKLTNNLLKTRAVLSKTEHVEDDKIIQLQVPVDEYSVLKGRSFVLRHEVCVMGLNLPLVLLHPNSFDNQPEPSSPSLGIKLDLDVKEDDFVKFIRENGIFRRRRSVDDHLSGHQSRVNGSPTLSTPSPKPKLKHFKPDNYPSSPVSSNVSMSSNVSSCASSIKSTSTKDLASESLVESFELLLKDMPVIPERTVSLQRRNHIRKVKT